MSDYDDRQSLGPVDGIEVLALKEKRLDAAGTVGPATYPCSPEQVAEILALWRDMPAAMQARCHIPPYGLCFYSGDHLVLRASLCWQCNNVRMTRDHKPYYSTFDATHKTARRLLQLMTEITRAQ